MRPSAEGVAGHRRSRDMVHQVPASGKQNALSPRRQASWPRTRALNGPVGERVYKIGIDVGGTFTDFVVVRDGEAPR